MVRASGNKTNKNRMTDAVNNSKGPKRSSKTNRDKRNMRDRRPPAQRPSKGMAGVIPNSGLIEAKWKSSMGEGSRTQYRLWQNHAYVVNTDLADMKTNIIVPALSYLINDKVTEKWNADQQDAYANLIVYSVQLLTELKNHITVGAYCPALTRADTMLAGSSYLWTLPSIDAYVNYLVTGDIKVPQIALEWLRLYTTPIQMKGTEFLQASTAEYFLPTCSRLATTDFQTLLGQLIAEYDAAVYAAQIRTGLVPLTKDIFYNIEETPLYSSIGNFYANFVPIRYRNGAGATALSSALANENQCMGINQVLGIPEEMDCAPLMRCTGGAAGNPVFLNIDDGLMTVNSTLSILVSNHQTTSRAYMSSADTCMDWLFNVANSMSRTQQSIFASNHSAYPYGKYKATGVVSGEAEWNNDCALWLSKAHRSVRATRILGRILPDVIASARRLSGAISPTNVYTGPPQGPSGPEPDSPSDGGSNPRQRPSNLVGPVNNPASPYGTQDQQLYPLMWNVGKGGFDAVNNTLYDVMYDVGPGATIETVQGLVRGVEKVGRANRDFSSGIMNSSEYQRTKKGWNNFYKQWGGGRRGR